jgi:hypothetical protein
MKQVYYLLPLLIFFFNCGNSQTANTKNKLTGNIQTDLMILLPNENVKADIMDGILQNPRHLQQLQGRPAV